MLKKIKSERGVFYGVGTGPGDPELMTLKAVKILESCPVIAAPRTGGGDMIALDIVSKAVSLEDKIILPLDFTMDRNVGKRKESYIRNAEAVAVHLDRGADVAMVNLGDVSIYSTFAYVAEELKSRGYETAMVPGVTSFSAIAAALDMSLTEMSEPLHVIPAVGADPEEYLGLSGTKVLMKAGRHLPSVLKALRERNLLEMTSMAVNCGMDDEVLIRNLGDGSGVTKEPGYFTTVIVKEGCKAAEG